MSSTLKEVSDRLGISPSTVSRALNERGLKRPTARLRAEQIKKVAAEMGYEANSVARSLKTNRRQIVGLILPDIMNDYYATAATLVQETLAAEGYRVILCVTNDNPEVEAAHLRVLHEERVAGIVSVPCPQSKQVKAHRISASSPPVVELVRQSTAQAADAILIDDIDAGFQGAQHLIDLGHQRIAVVTGPSSVSTSRLRLAGYRQALEKAGIPFDETLIRVGPYRREAAYAATLDFLKQHPRPTALIATSNELVVGVLQGLAQVDVRVPNDLSLVGFGNPDWFALLRPALTTVALPIREMAMVAARQLLARIRMADANDFNEDKAPVISRYQAHLIVRDSTRPPGMS